MRDALDTAAANASATAANIASNESKSVAGSWQQESITGACGKCNNWQIDGARGKGIVGQVVGVREYGQNAALAMATRGEGNDGQPATLAMDTHNKGNNSQIASSHGDRSATMGKLSRLRWPSAARATMGESPARAMATRGEGNDGQIASACGNSNVGQVDSMRRECNQNNNHPTTDGGV